MSGGSHPRQRVTRPRRARPGRAAARLSSRLARPGDRRRPVRAPRRPAGPGHLRHRARRLPGEPARRLAHGPVQRALRHRQRPGPAAGTARRGAPDRDQLPVGQPARRPPRGRPAPARRPARPGARRVGRPTGSPAERGGAPRGGVAPGGGGGPGAARARRRRPAGRSPDSAGRREPASRPQQLGQATGPRPAPARARAAGDHPRRSCRSGARARWARPGSGLGRGVFASRPQAVGVTRPAGRSPGRPARERSSPARSARAARSRRRSGR